MTTPALDESISVGQDGHTPEHHEALSRHHNDSATGAPHHAAARISSSAISGSATVEAALTALNARSGLGFVDIREEGASTTASPATNASAINSILQSGRVGHVPPGVFDVDRLQYDGNTGLVGAHPFLSQLRFVPQTAPGNSYNSVLSNDGNTGAYTDNVVFGNLTVDGNRANIDWSGHTAGDGLAYGVSALGVRGLTLFNLRLINHYTDGLNLHDSDITTPGGLPCRDVYGENAWIENCGRQGVTIESSVGVKLIGFDVRDINRTAPYASLDIEPTWANSIVDDILIAHWTADQCRPVALPVGTGGTNIRIIDYDHGISPSSSLWALYAANVDGLVIDGYTVRDHQAGGFMGYMLDCPGAKLRNVELASPTIPSSSFRFLGCPGLDIDGFHTPGASAGPSFEAGTTGKARNVGGDDIGPGAGVTLAAPMSLRGPDLRARDAGYNYAIRCLDGVAGAKIFNADADGGTQGNIDRGDHLVPVVSSYTGDTYTNDPTPTSATRSWAAPWWFDLVAWNHAWWAADPLWRRPAGTGNDVDSWRNEFGPNLPLTGDVSPPTLTRDLAQFGGHNVVSFDGVDQRMTVDFADIPQPYTIVVVAAADSTANIQRLVGSPSIIQLNSSTGQFVANAGAGLSYGAADTAPHLHVCYFNGASSWAELDGTRTTGDTGAAALTALAIGADGDGSFPLAGSIAAVGVKAGELTAQELSDLEAAVADYYPITIP